MTGGFSLSVGQNISGVSLNRVPSMVSVKKWSSSIEKVWWSLCSFASTATSCFERISYLRLPTRVSMVNWSPVRRSAQWLGIVMSCGKIGAGRRDWRGLLVVNCPWSEWLWVLAVRWKYWKSECWFDHSGGYRLLKNHRFESHWTEEEGGGAFRLDTSMRRRLSISIVSCHVRLH